MNHSQETENNGTIALQEVVKVLLDNGYTYTRSAPAFYTQPTKNTYVAYKTSVKPYMNWQDNFRNDADIILIFGPKTSIPSNTFDLLHPLGYKHETLTYECEKINSQGDSVAMFKKPILGTDIINGKVDTTAVSGWVSVIVQYNLDFDHKHAIKYYEKSKYDEYDEYEYREKHNTKQADKFIKELIKEIDTSKTGGKKRTKRTKRTNKKNKRKSVKQN